MLFIRLIFGSIACIFAIHCTCALSVSLILEDNPLFINGTIIHEITSYEGVSNVTIVDYFLEVEAEVTTTSEEFLGRRWYKVEIPAGDMQKGEIRGVTYKISSASGDALLGADIYYLDGERHQLFPRKTAIEVKPIASESELTWQKYPTYILVLILIVSIIIILITFGSKNKKFTK